MIEILLLIQRLCSLQQEHPSLCQYYIITFVKKKDQSYCQYTMLAYPLRRIPIQQELIASRFLTFKNSVFVVRTYPQKFTIEEMYPNEYKITFFEKCLSAVVFLDQVYIFTQNHLYVFDPCICKFRKTIPLKIRQNDISMMVVEGAIYVVWIKKASIKGIRISYLNKQYVIGEIIWPMVCLENGKMHQTIPVSHSLWVTCKGKTFILTINQQKITINIQIQAVAQNVFWDAQFFVIKVIDRILIYQNNQIAFILYEQHNMASMAGIIFLKNKLIDVYAILQNKITFQQIRITFHTIDSNDRQQQEVKQIQSHQLHLFQINNTYLLIANNNLYILIRKYIQEAIQDVQQSSIDSIYTPTYPKQSQQLICGLSKYIQQVLQQILFLQQPDGLTQQFLIQYNLNKIQIHSSQNYIPYIYPSLQMFTPNRISYLLYLYFQHQIAIESVKSALQLSVSSYHPYCYILCSMPLPIEWQCKQLQHFDYISDNSSIMNCSTHTAIPPQCYIHPALQLYPTGQVNIFNLTLKQIKILYQPLECMFRLITALENALEKVGQCKSFEAGRQFISEVQGIRHSQFVNAEQKKVHDTIAAKAVIDACLMLRSRQQQYSCMGLFIEMLREVEICLQYAFPYTPDTLFQGKIAPDKNRLYSSALQRLKTKQYKAVLQYALLKQYIYLWRFAQCAGWLSNQCQVQILPPIQCLLSKLYSLNVNNPSQAQYYVVCYMQAVLS